MKQVKTFAGILAIVASLATSQLFALTGLGIGVKGGVVSNYKSPNLDASTYKFKDLRYFGGFLKLGGAGLDLEVGPEYYWRNQNLNIGNGVKAKVSDFMLNATGKFKFNFPIIQPFIGGGVAMHKLNYSYSYSGSLPEPTPFIMVPNDKAYFGYHLVVGAKLSLPVVPVDVFMEGKIGKIKTPNEATDFTIIAAGVVLNLP